MTLLLIAYIVYAVVSIPYSVKVGTQLKSGWEEWVAAAGLVFAVVALCLFMASIGHGIIAVIILFPAIMSFIVGIVIGVVNELD